MEMQMCGMLASPIASYFLSGLGEQNEILFILLLGPPASRWHIVDHRRKGGVVTLFSATEHGLSKASEESTERRRDI
jgi:hypothetical protein